MAGDALAAAFRRPTLETCRRADRILLVGAAGRLGEAVLIALLGAGHIAHVHVATTAALPSSDAKLSFIERARIGDLASVGIDCAVMVLGPADGTAFSSSFYGRDKVFAGLAPDALWAVCSELEQQGVKRLVLIAPTPFHLQSAVFDRLVAGDTELQLVRWFDSLTVIRPGQVAPQPAAQSFMQRLISGYLSQLLIMLPAHRVASHPKRVGWLVCEAIRTARPGVAVLDSSTAAALGEAPMGRPMASVRRSDKARTVSGRVDG